MSDTVFIDADTYQGGRGTDLTVQTIIMQQIERISRLASTEWHGGFWYQVSYASIGNATLPQPLERYMPATNEAYSNAVDCLADLLAPFYDQKMKETETEHLERLKTAHTKLEEWFNTQKMKYDKVLWYDKKVRPQRDFFRALVLFVQRSGIMIGGSYEESIIG